MRGVWVGAAVVSHPIPVQPRARARPGCVWAETNSTYSINMKKCPQLIFFPLIKQAKKYILSFFVLFFYPCSLELGIQTRFTTFYCLQVAKWCFFGKKIISKEDFNEAINYLPKTFFPQNSSRVFLLQKCWIRQIWVKSHVMWNGW